MPRGFVKLNDGGRDWYFGWSTVVDAPTTFGMSLIELHEYVKNEHGYEAVETWWPRAVVALGDRGTTFRDASALDTLRVNRAGAGESCLSPDEIVEVFCLRQHIARDGRCLLKGEHTHMGPESVERCRWDDDFEPPRGAFGAAHVMSRDALQGLRESAKNKKGH